MELKRAIQPHWGFGEVRASQQCIGKGYFGRPHRPVDTEHVDREDVDTLQSGPLWVAIRYTDLTGAERKTGERLSCMPPLSLKLAAFGSCQIRHICCHFLCRQADQSGPIACSLALNRTAELVQWPAGLAHFLRQTRLFQGRVGRAAAHIAYMRAAANGKEEMSRQEIRSVLSTRSVLYERA